MGGNEAPYAGNRKMAFVFDIMVKFLLSRFELNELIFLSTLYFKRKYSLSAIQSNGGNKRVDDNPSRTSQWRRQSGVNTTSFRSCVPAKNPVRRF